MAGAIFLIWSLRESTRSLLSLVLGLRAIGPNFTGLEPEMSPRDATSL